MENQNLASQMEKEALWYPSVCGGYSELYSLPDWTPQSLDKKKTHREIRTYGTSVLQFQINHEVSPGQDLKQCIKAINSSCHV